MFLTGVDEFIDAYDFLDLFLGPDTDLIRFSILVDPSRYCDLLLHLYLDGQSMHIESRLITDVVSVHSPVSNEYVLYRLVQGSTHVYVARRIWRTINEIESLAVLTCFLGLMVCVLGVPIIADLLLDNGRCIIVADLFYHHESLHHRNYLVRCDGLRLWIIKHTRSVGTSADRTSPTVLAISHPVTTTSAIRRIHIGCRGIHQDLLRLDIIQGPNEQVIDLIVRSFGLI